MGCSVSMMAKVLFAIGDDMAQKGQKALVGGEEMNDLLKILGEMERRGVEMTEEEIKEHDLKRQVRILDELEREMEETGTTLSAVVEAMGARGYELEPSKTQLKRQASENQAGSLENFKREQPWASEAKSADREGAVCRRASESGRDLSFKIG